MLKENGHFVVKLFSLLSLLLTGFQSDSGAEAKLDVAIALKLYLVMR